MSASEQNAPKVPGEDDVLAGEYVLGVLDGARRRQVELRIATDPRFAARVADWQANLSPLDDAFVEVAPPAAVLDGIEARLFGRPEPKPGLAQSLAFWRGFAVACLMLAAGFAGLWASGALLPLLDRQPQLAAVLQADGSAVRMLAVYDPSRQTLRINTLAGTAGVDMDFELWLIEKDKSPVSLGVVPKEPRTSIAVSDPLRARLTSGVTLAVSVEPLNGSPTGGPTGPVVALGAVEPI